MAKLLLNDEIDYGSQWHPTHIITKDNKVVPVYLGTPLSFVSTTGIYVADDDYDKIRHDKAYVFLHNPDAVDEDIENVDWDEIPDVSEEENRVTNRKHVHLSKD